MKKEIILTILVIITIIEGILLIMPFKRLENEIEKVTYQNNTIDTKNVLSFYIDDGTGKFQEQTDRTKWPDKNTHSFMKADCYDDTETKIPTSEVLSFDNVTFTSTITTDKTVYCSLYFASTEDAVGLITKKDSKNQLETVEHMEARGDTLRRYQGQVKTSEATITNDVNNYICFGTNDEGICTKDTDKYLYRIIGIDTTNDELKLIKREALNVSQTWGSSNQTWANSTLQGNLNGTLFLKAQSTYEYMQEGETETYWTKIISPHNWGYGDISDYSDGFGSSGSSNTNVGADAYRIEKDKMINGSNQGTLENTKIGLIYASDYWLSGGASLKCRGSSSDYAECKKSWMHLSNNDTSSLSTSKAAPPVDYEWSMSRYDGGDAWLVSRESVVGYDGFGSAYSVRPVFYLVPGLKLSGDGTREHPFMIAGPAN